MDLRPDSGDPDPSPLLRGIAEELRSNNRVGRPAIRQGWLERRARPQHGTERGNGAFIEVPWDEALDLVADELRRVYDLHGPTAVFGGSYGWASAGRFHHPKGQLNRLLAVLGGFVQQEGNYSYAAGMTILPHVVGGYGPVAGSVPMWSDITAHTEILVLFGGMPMGNAQVNPGGIGQHQTAKRIEHLVARGTKVVHLGPRRLDIPDRLVDCQWIPIRPTTDVALMIGLAHQLIVNDLYDATFVTKYCVGFEQLRAYILGEVDGVPKDPRWASEITGVPADEISNLALDMAGKRCVISVTWAIQRARFGEQPYWMAVALASLLGQLGLPGGGVGFGYGNIASTGEPRSLVGGPVLPGIPNPCSDSIPVARVADMLLNPGASYEYNGETRQYPHVRLLYWGGGNPFHHAQDLGRFREAWTRPETIIVHEPVWTATARRADIVLPSTVALERDDLGFGKSDTHIIAMRSAVSAHAEAKDDFEIFREIARRLGVEKQYTEQRDVKSWLRLMYGRVEERASQHGVAMPPFLDFWEGDGKFELPTVKEGNVPFAEFIADPDANPLKTPSGRIELFSERIDSFGYDDCPGHPAWLEPEEFLGAPLAVTYPLHMLSHQPRVRLHSQHDFSSLSRDAKIEGREVCRLNADDAAARNIEEGDIVRLFNDRGECLAGARLDNELMPGVIMLPTGAWYDPDEHGHDKHGNPNVLTSDRPTSRLSQGPAPQSTLVQVERFNEALPEITAFGQPMFNRTSGTTTKGCLDPQGERSDE